VASFTSWCEHGQEFIPLPDEGNWVRFVPIVDGAAGVPPLLDAAGPGGQRAALPSGGGGAAGDRGGGVRAESGVAVQGLPIPGAVLGVEVIR
jgi:hypothetical protein